MPLHLKQPETYIVSLENSKETELPINTKISFNLLKNKYKTIGRISDFVQMLETTLGYKFELFDTRAWNDIQFQSYLMDQLIDFKQGKPIDLSQLHTDILKVYQFTKSEKRMFLELNVEERLWAIFLILNNPAHEEFKNIYNNND